MLGEVSRYMDWLNDKSSRIIQLSYKMPLLFQSLLDDRDHDLYYVRPMKDFTAKEISLYNMFYKLESQVIPTFTTKVWKMKL